MVGVLSSSEGLVRTDFGVKDSDLTGDTHCAANSTISWACRHMEDSRTSACEPECDSVSNE